MNRIFPQFAPVALAVAAGYGYPQHTAGAASQMALHPSHPASPYHRQYLAQNLGGAAPGAQSARDDGPGPGYQGGGNDRLFPIGFASVGTVAASATALVTTRPQILFRPERLLIPASVATNFNVADIRIGKNSQFVQSTAIAASSFSEAAVGTRMRLDPCLPGNDITLSVQNTDGAAAHAFAGTMFGESIDN